MPTRSVGASRPRGGHGWQQGKLDWQREKSARLARRVDARGAPPHNPPDDHHVDGKARLGMCSRYFLENAWSFPSQYRNHCSAPKQYGSPRSSTRFWACTRFRLRSVVIFAGVGRTGLSVPDFPLGSTVMRLVLTDTSK